MEAFSGFPPKNYHARAKRPSAAFCGAVVRCAFVVSITFPFKFHWWLQTR